jgi:2-phospho-L-lactate guanylyltransferase
MPHAGESIAVLLPVKAFSVAKRRLASALDPADRAALARSMADRVVQAAAPLPVAVVCDDAEVATWAQAAGATVLWRPGRGLNGAVGEGVDALALAGYHRVIVAHADLPHALDLAWLAEVEGVTLVPDRREDGTNVICLPADAGFRFSYGPGSFRRHVAEAERLALPLRIAHEPRLAWDVDLPADLVAPDWLAS